MSKIIIEYSGGFFEPCADETEAAQKIRAACVHDSATLHSGGTLISPRYSCLAFYERNHREQKQFVARVFGSESQLNLINQKV